ncbi:Signal peptidase complex subunit spc2 [Schizosaccharomyces pombe]|uniref:Signal peptidase complex subunit 2 n=1 Tax=Schizosaccharomyces pombe (strain 972 / ATCC 24843) TaxID=284812 RepID=SPC2_SCHPO|nr:putative signal peptidase subunit Spc2 [Schizosaccharomyces pombe]Q9UTQ9.1 RecName: Full=Signal peptidase complex subunit 2; AltName: Full=Microsomal signal peptidase subunit 2 [Schizosaccharomyces pombe 972h-]CAB59880.1 signal peptidase subunit Spc2 (predicted) [Schizosaccharomyces pombe]|eukprot:NP_594354.1 putative signal peptidase subunit Spc2 [Schizosaccharomyces pombe]
MPKYNVSDFKSKFDKELTNHFNKNGYKQSFVFEDIRLLIAIACIIPAGLAFGIEYVYGFGVLKSYLKYLLPLYFLASCLLTFWSSVVKGSTVYVATKKERHIKISADTFLPLKNKPLITTKFTVLKNRNAVQLEWSVPVAHIFEEDGQISSATFEAEISKYLSQIEN